MKQPDPDFVPTAPKIMLIRHAEKPPKDPPPHGITSKGHHDIESLTVLGWQRAGALAVFFAPTVGAFQNPAIATPATIYSSHIQKGSISERPEETITPLIHKLGSRVAVNFDFPKGEEKNVAHSALACDGVVLISWEHRNISKITTHFPISENNKTPIPSEWPDRYDIVWVFDLDSGSGGYCFAEIPQLLLAGDKAV